LSYQCLLIIHFVACTKQSPVVFKLSPRFVFPSGTMDLFDRDNKTLNS
jgi:hypothetical protein